MTDKQSRSPTRPFEYALRLEEIEHGTPFFLYDMRYGIIYSAWFFLPPNITTDSTWVSIKFRLAETDHPLRNGHPLASSLGLCPDKYGQWDANRFCVNDREMDRFFKFEDWLVERAPHDRVANRTLHQIGWYSNDSKQIVRPNN